MIAYISETIKVRAIKFARNMYYNGTQLSYILEAFKRLCKSKKSKYKCYFKVGKYISSTCTFYSTDYKCTLIIHTMISFSYI